MNRHALQAYETGAVDYVLKPLQLARLATTVARLKARLGTAPPDLAQVLAADGARASAAPRRYLQWINASRANAVRMIMVDDVCYFKADNRVTLVVDERGESVIRKTIKELAEDLDPEQFWQIHRSTLVNVAAIDTVKRDERGGMTLHLRRRSECLPVSEPYYGLFRQM